MFISEAFAVGAAICLALSSMFIEELKGRVSLLRLARWQFVLAFLMAGIAGLLLGGWRALELWQVQLLAASSLFGIVIASTTYFAAIYAIGPRLTALLFSLTSPFALVLGYAAFGETITVPQGLGVALVLSGIVLAIGLPRRLAPRNQAGPSVSLPAVSRTGIVLGIVTALGQALGGLFARPVMASDVEPFTAVAIRAGLAAAFFLVLALFPFGRAKKEIFRWKDLGLGAGATLFGSCLGMALLMAALERGDVGIVSTLSSMTPVVILPMVWIRTGIRPPARGWIGALLAITGTAFISLG
ncbi:DMT family transporter [Sphingosinicella sp. CPCC 101087]|uniref:DMT family transporter n=1 Tax=Sphingosinicella sp. CPCC 101087 TaxID=2497754 RepID=UPI00101C835A|nr:DMT family transporter [Sphingosinicella sp. CPCC 101087]